MSEKGGLQLPPAPIALVAPSYEHKFVEVMAGLASGKLAPPAKSGGRILWLDHWDGSARTYDVVQGVAIIPVAGVLLQEFPVIGWEYATGYNCLRLQIAQAMADPEIKAVVLWINSGGGEVSGCFDLVDWIVAAKAAAGKPVVAILDEMAYSAAYAIASAADTLTVPRTGGVGSIGVVMMHVDYSKILDEWGIKLTFIFAGKHKVDGHPYAELPEEVKAVWQAECEDIRQLFAATVTKHRSAAGTAIDIKAVLDTEAATFSSPSALAAAVKLGLADDIMAPLDALAAVIRQSTAAPV
nr:S49 family peptidase [uncultured Dongia sp.]